MSRKGNEESDQDDDIPPVFTFETNQEREKVAEQSSRLPVHSNNTEEENKSILNEDDDAKSFRATATNNFLPFRPENMTEEQKDYIVELFRMFHSYVLSELKDEDVPCLTAKELKKFAMDDSRLLTRCLYALATGQHPLDEAQKKNPYWQAQMYVSFCASELLARPCIQKLGYLQRFFSDQLSITPVTHNFKQICSFLRISGSPSFLRITNSDEVLGSILSGVEYPERGLMIFAVDNFGLKAKASYDQWTILQIRQVTEDQLKEVGFYVDKQDDQISRVRKSMEQLREETSTFGGNLAEEIVGIQFQDYKILTKYVLTHIQTALELKLPGLKECEKMDVDGSFGAWAKHCKVPNNFGLKLSVGVNQKSSNRKLFRIPRLFAPRDTDESEDEEEEEEEREMHEDFNECTDEYKSLYKQNNAFIDLPMHDDLCKAEAVMALMDYAIRANTNAKHNVADFGSEANEEVEPPVKEIMIPMCGDGSPVETSHRIKDVDKSTGKNKYDKIFFSPGGFHMSLEFHRMRGRLFEDILGIFVKTWRPSPGKMKWIIEPSDPNDALAELPEYILAHYRCACDCLAKINGCEELSPVQVNDHMLERAKSYPFAMAVLMELRFLEVALIFRDSEKSGDHGDVDAFVSAVRFALVLYTVTHAVKYVRICCEFLNWWAIASDAEKVLFRNFIFTRISPHGKPIWTDRSMEWTMEHLRGAVGKHKRRGQETLMETVCARMAGIVAKQNDVKALQELDASSKHALWNDKSKPLTKIFIKTYLQCKKINLYGPGPINITVDSTNSLASEEAQFFLRTPSGADLNAKILKCFTIGKERAKAYYQKFYIDSENIVVRTESEMGLDVVHGTAQRVKDGLQKTLMQATSTDSREIHASCTKKKLLEELTRLKEKWAETRIPLNLALAKKDDLVLALCTSRAQYYQRCPTAKQEETNFILSAQESASSSLIHERETELQDKFFQLDHSSSLKFEMAIKIATATL